MTKRKLYLACVTGQVGSERIIRAAGRIAMDGEPVVSVLSVIPQCPGKDELEAVRFLSGVAQEEGIEMTFLSGENPALTVVEYIKRKKVTHVLTGMPGPGSAGFIELLSSVLPRVRIIMIPQEYRDPGEDEEIDYTDTGLFVRPAIRL